MVGVLSRIKKLNGEQKGILDDLTNRILEGIGKLKDRLTYCIELNGDYIKK